MSKNQTKLITGVHNYCDRWCERCPFTQRCAVGIETHSLSGAQLDMENEAFWRAMSQNFEKSFKLLEKIGAEKGFDLKPPTEEELLDFEKKDAELRSKIKKTALVSTAEAYCKQSIKWFDDSKNLFEDKGVEFISHIEMGIKTEAEMIQKGVDFGECIEVIQWYMHFIPVKFSRALHGKIEDDGWETENGFPKDSDGSAKVALIATERSLGAWAKLADLLPEFADDMLPMLASLQKIIRLGDVEFPDARAFVRVGFDD